MRFPNRWRPALRIARRDALRARGRSTLVVVMIALPVLTMTAVDVLSRSAQLEPTEKVARTLGRADARVEPQGGRILQAPDPDDGWYSDGPPPDGDPTTELRSLLPAGARLLTARTGGVETETQAGVGSADWNEVRVGSPVFTGRFRHVSGHAPRGAAQVAVTSHLLDHLGVGVGDRVRLTDPARTVTVTGVYDQVGSPGYETFWAPPGALTRSGAIEAGTPSYYVVGLSDLTWRQVLALNAAGALVYSRDVVLHPPADSAVPFLEQAQQQPGFGSGVVILVLLVSVVVVLAALEVTLLAGAAFAVGARRSARSLGLVAASGGSRSDVRRIVLAGGVVLGLVGAVLGTTGGLVVAALARPLLVRLADADFGRFDVRPLELLAIAAVGLVTGVLAAVLPARTASRQDPVVALTGRRGQVRTPKKVPAIGLAITVVGIGAAALGSVMALALTTGINPMNSGRTALVVGLIAGGAALAQIGLIVTSPAVVGLAGRLSGPFPLTARLALRDAARHRGRSAPAMAAVLTAVTGSTALLLYVTSMDAHDRETYQPSLPAGHGLVNLIDDQYHPASQTWTHAVLDASDTEATIRGSLPPFTSSVVDVTDDNCFDEFCGYVNLHSADGFYGGGGFNGTPVGDAATLRELVGSASAAAVRTLADGGVVITQRGVVTDGHVTFDVVTKDESQRSSEDGTEAVPTAVTLPATYVRPTEDAAPGLVYSAGAAKALGLTVRPGALLLDFSTLPTQDQQEAATASLTASRSASGSLTVERGYVSQYGLGLLALIGGAAVITLGAAGIATGLAQADARADHATLAAVGAAPRARRSLAAAQALTVALLGTALGIAAGFVPALALIGAMDSLDVVVPWGRLLIVLVGIPLLAGALSWLLVRSRLPLERRVA